MNKSIKLSKRTFFFIIIFLILITAIRFSWIGFLTSLNYKDTPLQITGYSIYVDGILMIKKPCN